MKGISNLIDILYPIGSIYFSVNPTDPASIFGGSWERIQDRFLLAAGTTYEAGTTGGETSHALTTEEMPSHTHFASTSAAGGHTHSIGCDTDAAKGTYCSSVHGADTGAETFKGATSSAGNHTHTVSVSASGSGAAHNNMPPYLTVYMWIRQS